MSGFSLFHQNSHVLLLDVYTEANPRQFLSDEEQLQNSKHNECLQGESIFRKPIKKQRQKKQIETVPTFPTSLHLHWMLATRGLQPSRTMSLKSTLLSALPIQIQHLLFLKWSKKYGKQRLFFFPPKDCYVKMYLSILPLVYFMLCRLLHFSQLREPETKKEKLWSNYGIIPLTCSDSCCQCTITTFHMIFTFHPLVKCCEFTAEPVYCYSPKEKITSFRGSACTSVKSLQLSGAAREPHRTLIC